MAKTNIIQIVHSDVHYSDYRNALEPQSLVDAFLQYPPENFVIQNIPTLSRPFNGFFADLDLFTTLEGGAKKIVDKLRRFYPIDFLIRKCMKPNVLFVGTTVSEYCLLPRSLNFQEFKNDLMSIFRRAKRQFLIIKDIPLDSPLLVSKDNKIASDFITFLKTQGFIILTGQALAYLPVNFSSIEEYLNQFSAVRRKNFKRKMKAGNTLERREINTGDIFFTDEMMRYLYALYLNTYHKSDVRFDKLTLDFFKKIFQHSTDGMVFIYSHHNKIIGFNLCYVAGEALVDKYAGSLYPESLDVALFFNTTFDNIRYCLTHNLTTYIIGWTEPQTKASLGCSFTYTYHAIYIKNPVLRSVLSFFQSYFEGDQLLLQEMGVDHV